MSSQKDMYRRDKLMNTLLELNVYEARYLVVNGGCHQLSIPVSRLKAKLEKEAVKRIVVPFVLPIKGSKSVPVVMDPHWQPFMATLGKIKGKPYIIKDL